MSTGDTAVGALGGWSIGLALLWLVAGAKWRREFREPLPWAVHALYGGFIGGCLTLAALIAWRAA